MFVPFFSQHFFVEMSKPGDINWRHSHTHTFGETVLRNSVFLEIVGPELGTGRLAHAYSVCTLHTVYFRIRSLAQQNMK